MATITVPPPVGTTVPPSARESAPRQRRTRPVLLGCGLLSGVLYFAGDALMSAVYPGYSYLHQTVSELNAVGAPTWGISIALGLAGYLLLTAFGVGIWQSAAGNRRLRVVGGVLIGMGISSLWALPFASMQPRGAEQPAAHAVSGIVGTLLLLTALGFGATASGGRFHLYSITTIVAMLVFGGWAAMDSVRVEQGLPTPWVGVKERVSFYSWNLWFIVFALALLRQRPVGHADRSAG